MMDCNFLYEVSFKGTIIIFIFTAFFALGAGLYIIVKDGILYSVTRRDFEEMIVALTLAALFTFLIACCACGIVQILRILFGM